eukprot:355559_1
MQRIILLFCIAQIVSIINAKSDIEQLATCHENGNNNSDNLNKILDVLGGINKVVSDYISVTKTKNHNTFSLTDEQIDTLQPLICTKSKQMNSKKSKGVLTKEALEQKRLSNEKIKKTKTEISQFLKDYNLANKFSVNHFYNLNISVNELLYHDDKMTNVIVNKVVNYNNSNNCTMSFNKLRLLSAITKLRNQLNIDFNKIKQKKQTKNQIDPTKTALSQYLINEVDILLQVINDIIDSEEKKINKQIEDINNKVNEMISTLNDTKIQLMNDVNVLKFETMIQIAKSINNLNIYSKNTQAQLNVTYGINGKKHITVEN